jgi:hypothetical protein
VGEVAIDQLQQAVEGLHGCRAKYVRSVPVVEDFQGRRVWEGLVAIFALEGHESADTAYAWSHAIPGSDARRFVAVLREGAIKAPLDAVRAAIVQENEGG